MDDREYLVAYGRARFGGAWQTAMARLLGQIHPEGARDSIDPALVRKWTRGARPVPAWVRPALAATAAPEAEALARTAAEILARAGTLHGLAAATRSDTRP